MKIVHVVEPFSSGIITFIIHLTDALPDHEHLVIHGTRTTNDTIDAVRSRFSERVSFKVWPHADRSLNLIRDFRSLLSLQKMISQEEFDVIHLHSAKAGFIGKIAARLNRTRNVIYTPNSAPFLRKDISVYHKQLFRLLEKFSAGLGGQLIACGESEYHVYQEQGIKATYINNGIPIGSSPMDVIPKKPFRIVSSGILTIQKDPAEFNQIASAFAGDYSVKFTWIGDGMLRKQLTEPFIEVTGWLQKESSQRALMQADMYISTSLWEGQPFAVLEAMNNGKCLILRNCPGNRDLVRDGVNGYLFDTYQDAVSKIKFLIRNPKILLKMGQASYHLCRENHNIEKTALAYEEVYRRLARR